MVQQFIILVHNNVDVPCKNQNNNVSCLAVNDSNTAPANYFQNLKHRFVFDSFSKQFHDENASRKAILVMQQVTTREKKMLSKITQQWAKISNSDDTATMQEMTNPGKLSFAIHKEV